MGISISNGLCFKLETQGSTAAGSAFKEVGRDVGFCSEPSESVVNDPARRSDN